MKIAVASENHVVFQHFGRCPSFELFVTAGKDITGRETLDTSSSGHEALAYLLRDNGVEVLICGGAGDGARNALKDAGITIISGVKGDVDTAVKAYLDGTLKDNPAGKCNHHHHHGDHEGCGDHCQHGH